ncbi:MAG: hypothetical protein NTY77_18460 [Elusimicrobia bacterium]|nr:hypothetical protein [Elusimicrobiota bacterium]
MRMGSGLAALGLAVWLIVCAVSHRREAWDAGLYWTLGMPLMALASAVAGFLAPQRPWRWGLLVMAPQPLALFIQNPSGSMLPLGLIVFLVLSLPCILAALLGSWLRRLVSRDKSTG